MSMNEPGGFVGGGLDVPPIVPGELGGFGPEARWPRVLGTISIVLGGLGILKNACGVFSGLVFGGVSMLGVFGRSKTPEMAKMEETMAGMGVWQMVIGGMAVVSLLISVFLLVAGIQMLARRRVSIGMHKGWAWVRMGFGLAEVAVTVVSQVVMMDSVMASVPQGGTGGGGGGPPPAMMGSMMLMMGIIGGVFGLAIVLAYPIVVLAILGRPWAKQEVARWEGGADGGRGGVRYDY